MPRNRSASRPAAPSRAPTRPTAAAAPARPNQQRPATTMAGPPATQAPPAAAPAAGGSGLFGQMASTAAGVAVGSSIGHALGGFFGGGSSEAAPAPQQAVDASPQANYSQDNYSANNNCQGATLQFTQCMDEHQGNMSICNWYLEQLKACQSAAKNY